MWMLIELALVLAGFAATAVLFFRFPGLPAARSGTGRFPADRFPSVSVIIPARNEEENLPLLLSDLSAQALLPHEVICVDDASEDATAQVAAAHGARLVSLRHKPEGWVGKSWACQNGADAAAGDLLLFLDADVRLGPDGLLRLMQAYQENGCILSVQPYHRTSRVYEQLSLLFNLIQIAANGTALPKPLNIGLFGPVILIDRSGYVKAGGHERVKSSVIEDMALGLVLRKDEIPYRLFIGDSDIAYRMYGSGLHSLFQGWVKNLAAGASRTPLPVFLLAALWMTSLASVPLHVLQSAMSANSPWLAVYGILYAGWVLVLFSLARRIGRFQLWASIFFPVQVLAILGVFSVSMIKKVLGLEVVWKGRSIKPGRKP